MTVRELIEALSKFDSDLPVYLASADGGLDDSRGPVAVNVARDYFTNEGLLSFGAHDEYGWGDEETRELTPGVKVT